MTQQPKQPKRPPIEWIVNLPSHDPYGKVSFRAVCRGNGDLGDMLNYFIYAASYEVKHNHADKTTGFITVERTLDDIVDYLDVSKKTATTYIRKLAEWEFLIPHGYHHCYDVNFKKVDELIANPPEADKPKPRGKYAKREDGNFTIPTICEEDGKDSTDSRDEQIRELMEEMVDLSSEIVNLRSQMVNLSSTIIKLLSLPSFKGTPEEDLGAILEPLKKIKNLERKERDSFDNSAHASLSENDLRTFSYSNGLTTPTDTPTSEHTQGKEDEIVVSSESMATGNDLEDDPESTAKRPVVVLPQGERNTRHVSHSDPTDSDVLPGRVPGNVHDGTCQSEQGRAGVHPCLPGDIDATHTSGVAHDDTPATTHPSVPIGTNRATDLPLTRGSGTDMVSRQTTLQAGHVSSLQVQQGQEATQVQVIPSQQKPPVVPLPLAVTSSVEAGRQGDANGAALFSQTVPVPPAAVPPSLHPSQQATNAPVASVPPDREQRGAGETRQEKPKRIRTGKPAQPVKPTFTLTEQEQSFWDLWCAVWFNKTVPPTINKTAYEHTQALAKGVTTVEQLNSLIVYARKRLKEITGRDLGAIHLGNLKNFYADWIQTQQEPPPESSAISRNGSHPTISGKRRLDDDVTTPIDYIARAAYA